jgi:hypothetical protein
VLDLLPQIDAAPLLTDKQSKAITHQVLQLVGESQILPPAAGIEHAEICSGARQRVCHGVDRRDPNATGQQKILFEAAAELEMITGCRDGQVGARPQPPHESRPAAAVPEPFHSYPVDAVCARPNSRIGPNVRTPVDVDYEIKVAAWRGRNEVTGGNDLKQAYVGS